MNLPRITSREPNPESDGVSINVGGRIFQTTKQTLALAGSDSLLFRLAESTRFIDRDPELFSLLLSLLRTGNLPARSRAFDIRDLIDESRYYGIEAFLIDSLSNSSQFEAFNLQKSLVLPLNGRDSPSTIAAMANGGLHVAHGSKITSFDWSLRRKSTIPTAFSAVDSLLEISPGIAAAGATDYPGLQILDLKNGFVRHTLNWENPTRSSSTVQAIGSSNEYLFTSFESSRRTSNSIMVYDLASLMPVAEIDHREIYGSDIDSGIPSDKLSWIPSYNLLMASGSHSSPSGVMGHIRFWDIRTRNMVWEIKETLDCFSDVTVSDNLSAVFKVGVMSGEVFYTELRSLGAEDPWIFIGDQRRSLNGKREGIGCKINSYGNNVFCSKGGDLELCSEVITALLGNAVRDVPDGRLFRKSLMGSSRDLGGNRISQLAFGGNRMFVTRKDSRCIEVWQSPGREISI
ncbi:PREDICTED: BTB/POZ domain-containing protein At5g41330 [Tarenaya hassleriana]|uniref:BTB/POZ domain-containing protein At5g41330 n=1 Tax=Tarenaya hassleriana TaxID=28532 RepID=UPI00053C2ECD|nr:PREDICTED: BTB/POZ domain-containing protein At5g41330 [Tarenaya hassleriana]